MAALGLVDRAVREWEFLAAVPLAIAIVPVVAAVVLGICALFGFDPGRGGELLGQLVRDLVLPLTRGAGSGPSSRK